MDTPDPRHKLLLELFRTGLARVDGRRCVHSQLVPQPGTSPAPRPVWVAAVGKAASSMMLGAHDALGASIARALVITKDGHVIPELQALADIEIYESAHPMPDERSLRAGARLLRWVDELPEHVEPLFLISGGSSSLVEVLEPGTSFSDLERLTAEGLAAGIAIGELNARRARRSLIKGGKLTGRLNGRPARALFISDVPGDDPGVIGSGLLGPIVGSVDRVARTVVASIDHAVESVAAAAVAKGLSVEPASRRFEGDVMRLAVRFSHELHLSTAEVRVWGGESTVQLPEHPGLGGRNQHLGLAVATLIAGYPDLLLLAAGTDGTDGVTEYAGALVDAQTCERLRLAGIDSHLSLQRADSSSALAVSGNLVHTGPTGTNVGDLVIGLKLSAAAAARVAARPPGVL